MARWSRVLATSRFALALPFGLVFAFIILQAITLWQGRQYALQSALESTQNVQSTLRATIERNLTLLDLTLTGMRNTLKIEGLAAMAPALRNVVLFDRATHNEFLGSLLVLDPEGRIKYDSSSVEPRAVDLSDRDYFAAQKQEDQGVFLSHPFISHQRTGDPSIALSRRLEGPDGQFEGVVIATLRLAFFSHVFEEVKLGSRDVISLVMTDGTIILRHPPDQSGTDFLGKSFAGSPIFQRMLHDPSYFMDTSRVDGVERYYVHSRIGDFPLILSVAFSVEDALAEWRERSVIVSTITLVMSIGIIALVLALRRMLLRSYKLEQSLRLAALTDPLTGLANRRAFDDAMEREWKRSSRTKTPLCLIVADGDHFKAVNDTFGHAGGDLALKMIADRIGRGARRPSDVAARYGGEEFAILLPNTTREGALNVAENIRVRVDRARITLPDGRALATTISLGIASMEPGEATQVSELFEQADAALYRAKRAGRNAVAAYDPELDGTRPLERDEKGRPGYGARTA